MGKEQGLWMQAMWTLQAGSVDGRNGPKGKDGVLGEPRALQYQLAITSHSPVGDPPWYLEKLRKDVPEFCFQSIGFEVASPISYPFFLESF